MPYFSTNGDIFVEAQHVPELPLGSSIFRHRDECIRIAKWCGGTTGLGNGGIWVDVQGGERKLTPLGSWIVKGVSGEYNVYSDEDFRKEFPYEKLTGVEV